MFCTLILKNYIISITVFCMYYYKYSFLNMQILYYFLTRARIFPQISTRLWEIQQKANKTPLFNLDNKKEPRTSRVLYGIYHISRRRAIHFFSSSRSSGDFASSIMSSIFSIMWCLPSSRLYSRPLPRLPPRLV